MLAHYLALAAPSPDLTLAAPSPDSARARAQLGTFTCPSTARHTHSPGAALALRSKSIVYTPALNYLVRARPTTVYKLAVLRSPSPYLNLLVNTGLGKSFRYSL